MKYYRGVVVGRRLANNVDKKTSIENKILPEKYIPPVPVLVFNKISMSCWPVLQ